MQIILIIFSWLKIIFRRIKPFTNKYVDPVILFLESIKGGLESKDVKTFVLTTKTKIDDKVLEKVHQALAKAILALDIVKGLKGNEKDTTIIYKFIEQIKELNKPMQDALLFKTASLAVNDLSGEENPLKTSDADTLVQLSITRLRRQSK